MAFTSPRTWVTGELMTASLLNTYIRDNQSAMVGGHMAITSQAQGDVLYASSATALARLGADAGKYLKSGAAAPTWESLDINVLSKTGTYTVLDADGPNVLIKADATSAAFTITLLAAATAGSGAKVTIVNNTPGAATAKDKRVTIDGNASETIQGSLTQTLWRYNQSITMVCDGSNWFITSQPVHVTSYPVTLNKLYNSTSETALFTWNMAADTLQEGDSLEVLVQVHGKQNTGSTETIYWDCLWDSSADGGSAVEFDLIDISVSNNSSSGQGSLALRFARGGSATNDSLYAYYSYRDTSWNSNSQWNRATNHVENSSVEFDKDNVVSLKVDFSTASTSFYIVPWSAQVILYRGSSGNLAL